MGKPTEFWQWYVESTAPPGRRIKTKHKMTREQALERDPSATPVLGTCEVRSLPETDEEVLAKTHTGRGRVPSRDEG